MDYTKNAKKITEKWFSNHTAKYTRLSDSINILIWRNLKSCDHHVRYVFDGPNLYITGDIGEALFCFKEKIQLSTFKNYDVHYFHSKLKAFSEEHYSFDSDVSAKKIQEEIDSCNCNREIGYDGSEKNIKYNKTLNNHILILQELITESNLCSSRTEWESIVSQRYDELTEYDLDIDEWIFSAGDVIPERIQEYFVGLQMAAAQLPGSDE